VIVFRTLDVRNFCKNLVKFANKGRKLSKLTVFSRESAKKKFEQEKCGLAKRTLKKKKDRTDKNFLLEYKYF